MKSFIPILVVFLFIIGCKETDIISETGQMEITDFNLPHLPDNYHYQGWLLVDGGFVSVGKITNDSIQQNKARFDKIDQLDLNKAQSFALTVERSGSGAPSDFVLLVGNFNGNSAELDTETESANGISGITKRVFGSYTIQNASVPEGNENMYGTNGVWFFKKEGDQKQPILSLDYKQLWYQAWVVKKQNDLDWNMNVGVIKSDTLSDNYRGFTPLPYTENIPKFPGEDFLQQPGEGTAFPDGFFPADVRGAKVIITPIFQNYTDTQVPFPISVLEATIPEDAQKDQSLTRELHINNNYGARAVKLN